MSTQKSWTLDEIQYLQQNWQTKTDRELSDLLGKTTQSVIAKRRRLNLLRAKKSFNNKHVYTYQEVQSLFSEKNYKLISREYQKMTQPLEYICQKHSENGIQTINLCDLLRGRGCSHCGRKRTVKAKMKSDLYYKELCNKLNFTYVDRELHNQNTHIKFICNKHKDKGVQIKSSSNIEKRHGCIYCSGKNQKSHKTFVAQISDILPNIEILSPYTNQKQKVSCQCKIHQIRFSCLPANLLQGQNPCNRCRKIVKTSKDYEEKLYEYHPELELVSTYVNSYTKVEVHCKVHNTFYEALPNQIIHRKTCCYANERKNNEAQIYQIIKNWGFSVQRQKTFVGCKDKFYLPFDFYLSEENVCIEYDGEQHYMPISFGEKDKAIVQANFERTKRHDQMKDKFCKDNNILLIRIPYWYQDELEYFLLTTFIENNILKKAS